MIQPPLQLYQRLMQQNPTDPPGFAVDEDPAHLGEALKLPEKYEAHRARIEQILPEIRVPS